MKRIVFKPLAHRYRQTIHKPLSHYLLTPLHKLSSKLFRFTSRLLKPIAKPIKHFVFSPLNKLLKRVSKFKLFHSIVFQTASVLTLILIVTISFRALHQQALYRINPAQQRLLSTTSIDTSLIKETKDSFSYNHNDEVKGKKEASLVLSNPADATGAVPYQATLSKDPSKGMTFSDANKDQSVTLTPNQSLSDGVMQDNRVIYPASTTERHSYTFKRNGIKEDIILTKSPNKDGTQTFSWTLNSDTLEAKPLGDGAIGLYSADSILSGDVQTNDPASKALLEKARKNATKTNLVFVIPAPYLMTSTNQQIYEGLNFSLTKDEAGKQVLTLSVIGLSTLDETAYPISIDPTITVTTTSDFQQNIGDTGNIDTTTADQIGRQNIGSGVVGSTTQQTAAFTTARQGHTSVVYNGYIYIIGGYSGSYQNDIQYSWIDTSTGALCLPSNHATCSGTVFAQQTSAFTTARQLHTSVVYNGYLYIIGGDSGTRQNDIQYSWIDTSTGALCLPSNHATCSGTVFAQQTAAFTTTRYGHASVAYNGYLYIIGGWNGTTYYNDIQYCPINADGSVGTCTQQTSAFTTARQLHTSVVYNGYLYIIGGDSGTSQNDIQYSWIDTSTGALCLPSNHATCSGTVFAQQTAAFTTARYRHTSVVYNGYLYIIGGWNGTTYYNDIQYCRIKSDGAVDFCSQQTSAFTTARYRHTSVAYNGYLYIIGGYDGSYYNDVQRLRAFTNAYTARYERTIDIGYVTATMDTITANGTATCGMTLTYRTAGSNGIYGSSTTVLDVYPGVAKTITTATVRYIQLIYTLNDSTCGGTSNISSISLTYNGAPDAPTLILPTASATAVSLLPEFRLGSTDDSNDYLKYKIEVCSTSNCSSIVRTIDQTSSQTGWVGQSVQSGTAYAGGLPLTQVAIHQYQTAALTASTQYWWRAYAVDPGGSNVWSSASSISTFTTGTDDSNTIFKGGVQLRGGTTIK